jgi:hypothetical protein
MFGPENKDYSMENKMELFIILNDYPLLYLKTNLSKLPS